MILFLTLLLNIELNNLLPSKEIWENYQEYLKNGIIQDFQKKHFIFDDANNTGFDSDKQEMIELYEIQENIYRSYGIRSYIFFIKYIDSSLESFGLVRNRTRDNLRNNNYNVDKSIFSVISVDTIDLLIYTGKYTKRDYISDDIACEMKNNIIKDLQNGKYYDSLKNFLVHLKKVCSLQISSPTNDYYHYEDDDYDDDDDDYSYNSGGGNSGNKWELIIGIGIYVILIVLCILFNCLIKGKCKCCEHRGQSNINQSNNNIGGNSISGINYGSGNSVSGINNGGGYNAGINNYGGGYNTGVNNYAGGYNTRINNYGGGYNTGVNNYGGGYNTGVNNYAGGFNAEGNNNGGNIFVKGGA